MERRSVLRRLGTVLLVALLLVLPVFAASGGTALPQTPLDLDNLGPIHHCYYEQLDPDSQLVYDALLESGLGRDGVSTERVELGLTNFWEDQTVTLGENNGILLSPETQAAIDEWINAALIPAYLALVADHPSLSWLVDIPYQCDYTMEPIYFLPDETEVVTTITIDMVLFFLSTETVETVSVETGDRQALEEVVYTVRAMLEWEDGPYRISRDGATLRDRVETIHNYICDTAVYIGNTAERRCQTVYGLLSAPHKADSRGYARAFQVLCEEYQIPCVTVSGRADTSAGVDVLHMWNYVQMEDELWYAVDCACDDAGEGGPSTDFFLVGSGTRIGGSGGYAFQDSHRPSGVWPQSPSWCIFSYPALNDTAYGADLACQELYFADIPEGWVTAVYGDGPFAYPAVNRVDNGGEITYRSSIPAVAEVGQDGSVTIAGVGETVITATASASGSYAETAASYTLEVWPKSVAVTAAIPPKLYDGTCGAEVLEVAVTDGLVDGDSLTLAGLSAVFGTKDVGRDKDVFLDWSNLVVFGDCADCYELILPDFVSTGEIFPRILEITGGTVVPKRYDGSVTAVVTEVNFCGLVEGESLACGEDYTVPDAAYDAASAGPDRTVTGTVALLPDGPTARNYCLGGTAPHLLTVSGQTILPADFTATVTLSGGGELTYGDTLTVLVTALQAKADTLSRSLGSDRLGLYLDGQLLCETETTDGGGVLFYPTADKGIPLGETTLTVAYGGSENFNAQENLGAVTVTLDPRPLTAAVLATDASAVRVYNGTTVFPDVALSLLGVAEGDEVSAAASGSTDSARAGTRAFFPTGVVLSGEDRAWYSLAPEDVSGAVTIQRLAPVIIIDTSGGQRPGETVTLTIHIANPLGVLEGFPSAQQLTLSHTPGAVERSGLREGAVPGVYTADYTLTGNPGDRVTFSVNVIGAANYDALDAPVTKTVSIGEKGATRTLLETSQTAVTYGDSVTLTATVTGEVGGHPAGTVQFRRGDEDLGNPQRVAEGRAVLTVGREVLTCSADPQIFTAEYISGDHVYSGSISAPCPVSVARRALTVCGADVEPKVYDGATSAVVKRVRVEGMVSGETLVWGVDYTVSGVYSDPNAGGGKEVLLTLALGGTAAQNYVLSSPAYTLTGQSIAKAPALTPGTDTLTVRNGLEHAYRYDLSRLLPELEPGKELGDVSCILEGSTGGLFGPSGPDIQGMVLSLPIRELPVSDGKADAGTVTVRIVSQNYEDMTAVLTIAAANRERPQGAPQYTPITAPGKVLADGNLSMGTLTPAGTLQWDQPENTEVTQGTAYGWTFTPLDTVTCERLRGSIVLWPPSPAAIPVNGTTYGKTEENGKDDSREGGVETVKERRVQITAVVHDGVAETEVDRHVMDKVLGVAEGRFEVELVVSAPSPVNEVRLLFYTAVLRMAVEKGLKTLTITSPLGQVTLDRAALEDVLRSAGGDAVLLCLIRTDGEHPAYRLSFQSGGTFVESSAGQEWERPFEDVREGDWYYSAVHFVSKEGLLWGGSENLFGPHMPLTRAALVDSLWRCAGRPDAGNPAGMDVPADAWYAAAADWAVSQGITAGTGGGFGLEETATREQLVTMLHRLAGAPKAGEKGLEGFLDGGRVSPWARAAILWAVQEGILIGGDGNLLLPGAPVDRAQAAVVLQRYLER